MNNNISKKEKLYNLNKQTEKFIQNNIKVLSYNLCWEAMTGNTSYYIKANCPFISDGVTKCLANITQFIDKNSPFDLIGLQEATNFEKIKSISNHINEMSYVVHKPNIETMISLYNPNKFKLDSDINMIKGFMKDLGRPFIILFFNNHLCHINIHSGHDDDAYELEHHIKDILTFSKKNNDKYKKFNLSEPISSDKMIKDNIVISYADEEIETILYKLKSYDIIITGDFNSDLKKGLSFFGRTLYGYNSTDTCCDDELYLGDRTDKSYLPYDHILSSFDNIKSKVYYTEIPSSDHLPIIANIRLS